jgi:hypothetical protein
MGSKELTHCNLLPSDALRRTKECLGLEGELATGLVDEDVRRVDLDTERSSRVGVFPANDDKSVRKSDEGLGGTYW